MKRTARGWNSTLAPSASQMKRSRLRKRGKRSSRDSVADAKWRDAVRANAQDGLCQACMTRLGQHCHHIYTRAAHPDLRHVVANGILLCVYCHDTAHADMRSFRAWWAGEDAEFAKLRREVEGC